MILSSDARLWWNPASLSVGPGPTSRRDERAETEAEEDISGMVSMGGTNTVEADPESEERDLRSSERSEEMVRRERAGEWERTEGSGRVRARLRASLWKLLRYSTVILKEKNLPNRTDPSNSISCALGTKSFYPIWVE